MIDPQLIEKYQKILSQDPQSKLFAPLADALRESGDLPQAERVALEGLRRHPEYVGGVVILGRILIDKKEFTQALPHLEKALQLSSENILAYQLMAEVQLQLKKPAQALKAHKMVLFFNPLNEKSQRAVEKLEKLTAIDYDEDVFEFKHKPAVGNQKGGASLERNLALIDALILRNDLDRSKELLAEVQKDFPQDKKVNERLKLLEMSHEEAVPLEPLPPKRKVILQNQIRALENVLKALDDRISLESELQP